MLINFKSVLNLFLLGSSTVSSAILSQSHNSVSEENSLGNNTLPTPLAENHTIESRNHAVILPVTPSYTNQSQLEKEIYKYWDALPQWNKSNNTMPQQSGIAYWVQWVYDTLSSLWYQEEGLLDIGGHNIFAEQEKTVLTNYSSPLEHLYERGIDVSHWQGRINWTEVSFSGIKFGIAKATEGNHTQDPNFSINWLGMKSNNITALAYHYFRGEHEPITQIANINSTLTQITFNVTQDILAIDVEARGNEAVSPDQMSNNLWELLTSLNTTMGVNNIYIYCSPNFWEEKVNWTKHPFDHYKLWVASWREGQPHLPSTWKDEGWSIWQYSSKGQIQGIQGDVDLDLRALEQITAFPSNTGHIFTDQKASMSNADIIKYGGISERAWNFTVGESQNFHGEYGSAGSYKGFERGCNSFTNGEGNPIAPKFQFNYAPNSAIPWINGCVLNATGSYEITATCPRNIDIRLEGITNVNITNVSEVHVLGEGCDSGL